MKEFTKLARRQAGGITIKMAIASAVAVGVVAFGVAAVEDYENIQELGVKAHAMAGDLATIGKIRSYFSDESGRLEGYHEKNLKMFADAAPLAPFLATLPSSPTLDALTQDESKQYGDAKATIADERASSEAVWKALTTPEDHDALKAGLTPKNLEIYSSVKDCALRGAGEGAYCGPAAAVGVRAQTSIEQAKELQAQSEAFARQSLATGWDDWDGAKAVLTQQANAEIDQAKAQAKQSFDRGDIDQDDWNSLNAGFDASRVAATNQIAQDGQDLQQRVNSGHLSGFDWYLLSRWSSSSSSVTQIHVINHPYMAGASSYVDPSSVLARSAPSASQGSFVQGQGAAAAHAAGAPSVQGAQAGQAGQGAQAANYAHAQAPQTPAPAARIAGLESANASARAGLAAQVASAGKAVAAPNTARVSAPSGVNPYSVNVSSTPFGAKVSESFAKAAGPRMAAAVSGGYATRGGIASRVANFSSARSSTIHSSSSGHSSEGVGHASVGHASSGHGGGSGG